MIRDRSPILLTGFLLLSLLLHLLLLLVLPREGWFRAAQPKPPMVVEMRPAPQPEVPRPRELDLPPPERETPREEPAKRLGPADQVVEQETAPPGEMPEDRTVATAAPKPAPRPQPPARARPEVQEQAPAPKPAAEPAPERPVAERPAPAEQTVKAPDPTLPSLAQLQASALQAAASVAEQQLREWRRKYREDVEQGDAVWLDTERDILINFFQRFRDQVYNVWNYPAAARQRGEEGTCLLKVTVNRDGSLRGVELMESSGSGILDHEAMAAVRKAAPFGPLPQAYPKEELSIFGFFKYDLVRRVRPGEIF